MKTYHALRYLPSVPLNQRKHTHTVGRWSSWLAAEEAREASPVSHLLEVVERAEAAP